MKERITRINRTLFEMETGILIYGGVCQIFVIFVKDKAGYSLGLWLGITAAVLSAAHMYWALNRALDLGERGAVKSMTTQNILRYLFIAGLLIILGITEAANPLSAFLGVMGLKAAAYMQLFTRKISRLIYGEEILPEIIEEPVDGQER